MRKLLALAMSALALCGAAAHAEYPEHVITGIVPFDTGGGSDIFGRIVATYLTKTIGQNVVIVNKPGGLGNLGVQFVADSKPDGYTFLSNGVATTQNAALFQHLRYDPLKDLQPVAELANSPLMVAVNAEKIPSTNLRDFVDLVKKNPGKYNAGGGGIVTKLVVGLFELQNGLSVEIVPYDSMGRAITAIAGGEVDFTIADPAPLTAQIKSGKLRALAVTGERRLTEFPDVPTTKEAGFPEYQEGNFYGIYVRGGTPQDIVHKLNAALNKVATDPEVIEKFRALGFTAVTKTPEEFSAKYRADIAKWRDVVARTHIPFLD